MNCAKKSIGFLMVIVAGASLATAQDTAGWLARETAKDYRELARFPDHSRALKKGEGDPIKAKRLPTRQTLPGPDGAEPVLAVWASKVSYEKGQPVDLFASVENRGKARPAAEVTAEIVDASGAIVARAVYQDDGRAPDQKAGDGVYSARLVPDKSLEPELAASYMVRARARLLDGDLREAVGGFLLSNPSARLTGRYRDAIVDGNLVISAEVEVSEAGRFHLAGTLASSAGEPIGWAQAAAHLEPGRQWIDLSYYGLIFHDRQAAGPFRLETVALSTTTSMPNALNDLVENAHVTRSYRLGRMRREPFAQPQLLETAKRLEADALRAERERLAPERQ
jgi:hypothetical protein